MKSKQNFRDKLRSTYAIKLLGVVILISLLIILIATAMAFDVSDRVTEEQLQSVEANAQLEAQALARWIDGEQESIRILSTHRGIDINDSDRTQATLSAELVEMTDELVSLHIAERPLNSSSNGTTEKVIASTDTEIEGQPLDKTNIDWGEDTDGDDQQYTFEGPDDVLLSWVYVDNDDEMAVAIASPIADEDYVLIGEYQPSVRIQESANMVEGTETLVLGGVSAYVMFDETNPDEFQPYKNDRESTEVGSRILDRENQFATLNGSESDDTEVRGYHSVPADGVNWIVVKEVPRSNALALTEQIQKDLLILIGTMFIGFLLIGATIQYGPIRSIKKLSEHANAIARGNLSAEIEDQERIDEIGELWVSFSSTKSYIETIARQTEALSNQRFDADVLDAELPGPIGTSISAMHNDVEAIITELESEQERYAMLVQQSTDGIVVTYNGQYAFISDRFVEITGYDREQLLHTPFEDVIVSDDRDRARELCDQQLAEGTETKYGRLSLVTADSERRVVELVCSRVRHNNKPSILINVQDVTKRQRREKRLEIFNRVLRHNLRHAFQVIIGVLDSIDTDTTAETLPVTSAQEQSKKMIDTAAKARRIDDAFENLTIHTHDLGKILSSLETRAKEEYPSATIDFTSQTVAIEAAQMLDAALWELVENAFEYAGDNPRVEVDLKIEDRTATLSISDNGPGLPATEQETLESGGETDLQHASGLGLWFAYWTVEASSGDLSFDVSGGTTVLVTLPLANDSQNLRTDE